MYQGKFDAKARGQRTPDQALDSILRERAQDDAARAAKKTSRDDRRAESQKSPARPAPQPSTGRPARREALPPETRQPAPQRQHQTEVARKQRRGPRIGGIIFYTLYFMMIFAFFIGVFMALNWLNGWLKDYEASQPTVKCQQIFDELFGSADWARLYQLTGDPNNTGKNTHDTQFEGVNSYVTYMNNKTAGKSLNYVETSAGIGDDKKYIVRLDTEKIATFTLHGETEEDKITAIPDWSLSNVEIFMTRQESVKVRKMENHTVYVNGQPLDDSYTIQVAYTKADEARAPEDRIRTSIQEVSGLLVPPELLVYDQTGAPIEVRFNPDSGMYEEQIDAIAMSEEERSAVFGALEAYAGFMINASGSRAALAKYFDSSSQTYNDILKMGSELWMNTDHGHTFLNQEILGYTKHSADMFTVRASMTMHVKCKDSTEKDYDVLQSMYFTNKNGKWVCTEMTNEDITAPVGEVRLTFCDSDGNILSSAFYATTTQSLTAPVVEAPAGKVFSGWCTLEVNEQGQKTWNLVFQPDASGNIYLGSSYNLLPMVLYPLFSAA